MAGMPVPVRVIGSFVRVLGQAMDKVGTRLQGKEAYTERLVPSTRVVPFKGKSISNGKQAFVASSASVIGDVRLGEMSSVWYGASARGDGSSVSIGRGSSVMDNAVVAAERGAPVSIGEDVVVAQGAFVVSAAIGDGTTVGMGAHVGRGAKIGADCYIDAGAVVPAGAVIPRGTLWTGVPARQLRVLSADEIAYLRSSAVEAASLSQVHFAQGEKSVADLEQDEVWRLYRVEHELGPDAPIPEETEDAKEYFKLTQPREDQGLFRSKEVDVKAEVERREAEEVAADAAEEQYYAGIARARRVAATLQTLVGIRADRPALREDAIGVLARTDPQGADQVRAFVAAAVAPENKPALVSQLLAMDASSHYPDDAAAAAAAERAIDALAKHAAAMAVAAPAPAKAE